MLAFYLSTLDEKIDKMDFEQIYLKFHDDVLKRIQNILKNEEDIKDVVQLTWLTVLKNMSLFQNKDEQSIKAYIIAIARNQSISIIRKRRKEADLFHQIESETAERISDEDFFDMCEAEGISRVVECINMLGYAQKEVIILYYLYHHSLKDIANILNISEVVAKSRWSHGRNRLMKLLIERGIYVKKENDRA